MWVVNKYTCKHLENGHEHRSLLLQAETRYHLYARKTEDKIRQRRNIEQSKITKYRRTGASRISAA